MKNGIIVIVSFFLLFHLVLTSCKNDTIPESDMVKIFSEVFITDAIVSTSNYSYKFSKRDSIDYYSPIYTKMGYTNKQFEQAMDFYLENPKELDNLLDKVVNYLAQLEAEREIKLEKNEGVPEMDNISIAKNTEDLWQGNKSYQLPTDSDKDSIYFKYPVIGFGKYKLTAKVKVLPNDESIEPYAAMWFTRDSSGTRANVERKEYIKDGRERLLNLTIELNDSTQTHIEGMLMGHIEQDGDWKKFVQVSDIKIAYTPTTESPLVKEPIDRKRMIMDADTNRFKSRVTARELQVKE